MLDRRQPVARIVPVAADDRGIVVRRREEGSLHEVRLPPPLRLARDVAIALLEDRETGR